MITVVYNGSDIINIKNHDTWRRTNTCDIRQICFYERQIPQSHGILYVNLRNDNFHRLPQLRGLPTATAVALEEAAMRWPWKKAASAAALQKSWMNSPILFKAFGLLLQHPAARFEADAVSFEASAVFEADAFFFTPLPAIFSCRSRRLLVKLFLLVNLLPHRFQVLITASKAVDADVCCCVGQVTEKTTSPQQMHCATRGSLPSALRA